MFVQLKRIFLLSVLLNNGKFFDIFRSSSDLSATNYLHGVSHVYKSRRILGARNYHVFMFLRPNSDYSTSWLPMNALPRLPGVTICTIRSVSSQCVPNYLFYLQSWPKLASGSEDWRLTMATTTKRRTDFRC